MDGMHACTAGDSAARTNGSKGAELGRDELLDGSGFLGCSHQARLQAQSRPVHGRDHLQTIQVVKADLCSACREHIICDDMEGLCSRS